MPAYVIGKIENEKDIENLLSEVNKVISDYINNYKAIINEESIEFIKEKSYEEGYDDGYENGKNDYDE